jgi:integrase
VLVAKFCNYQGNPRWRVSVFINGRRKQRYFKTQAEANQWIQELKSTGCAASFWAALSKHEQLNLVGAYRVAQQRSVCLLDAAIAFSGTKEQNQMSLAAAVHTYLVKKESESLRDLSLKQIRWKLGMLTEHFDDEKCNTITPTRLEQWFAERKWARSTIDGVIAKIGPFFTWCVREGYCESNPCKAVKRPKSDNLAPAIFTPSETKKLLQAALRYDPRLTSYLAIGLFAGIRPFEIQRLTWADISDRYIEVKAAKAKTRKRRLVSLCPNIKEWLNFEGDLSPTNKRKRLARVINMADLKWSPDIMRHSFASYHLAMHHSADKTAFELGHCDSKMLFAHYRELVTQEAAQAYWAIRP